MAIEVLESRIAPAAVYSYLDVDGDTVKISSSKGSSADLKTLVEAHRVAAGSGFRIDEIDFTSAAVGEFTGAAITVGVTRGPQGDGRVELGWISAGGLPLASFMAPHASVQKFNCGDGTHGIGTLALGSYGTVAPGYFVNGVTDELGSLSGNVGSVHIRGDIAYGGLIVGGDFNHNMVGSVFIGGNLLGTPSLATVHAGTLVVLAKSIGSVTVRGSVVGGSFDESNTDPFSAAGLLEVFGVTDTVSIHGDILGGAGKESAFVGVLVAKTITVGGSIVGGRGEQSANANLAGANIKIMGGIAGGPGNSSGLLDIETGQTKPHVFVGGSIVGGTNNNSGVLETETPVASITVKGSVIGGTTATDADIGPAGAIDLEQAAGQVTVHGNVEAGSITSGNFNFNGSVLSRSNIQSLRIGGSVVGSSTNRALILAEGETPSAAGSFNAIGSLQIGGSVAYAVIASGHDFRNGGPTGVTTANLGTADNPDAGIGPVTIGGDFYHSSILAGTNDKDGIGAGRINFAGTSNPDTQSVGEAARIARLGPVTIHGNILDDDQAAGDSGFEAEQIQSISAGGALLYQHGDGVKFFDLQHFVFASEIPVT